MKILLALNIPEEFFPEYPGVGVNQAVAKSRLPDIL
jgi:hypothetical protein